MHRSICRARGYARQGSSAGQLTHATGKSPQVQAWDADGPNWDRTWPAAAHVCPGIPPSPPSLRRDENPVTPQRGGVWHGPGRPAGAPRFRREQKEQQHEGGGFDGAAFADEGEIGKRKNGDPSASWWRGSSPSGARGSVVFEHNEARGSAVAKPRNAPAFWTRPRPEAWGKAPRAGAPTRRAPDPGKPGVLHPGLEYGCTRVTACF